MMEEEGGAFHPPDVDATAGIADRPDRRAGGGDVCRDGRERAPGGIEVAARKDVLRAQRATAGGVLLPRDDRAGTSIAAGRYRGAEGRARVDLHRIGAPAGL